MMRKTSSGKPLSRGSTAVKKREDPTSYFGYPKSGSEIVVVENTPLKIIRQKILRTSIAQREGKAGMQATIQRALPLSTPVEKNVRKGQQLLLKDLDGRFCSTGELGSIKESNHKIWTSTMSHHKDYSKESSVELDGQDVIKEKKIMLLSTKIRNQAKKIVWLEEERTKIKDRLSFQNHTENSEFQQYSMQTSLLLEENTLLKQKISVLEEGMHQIRAAAEEEGLRANNLETELTRMKKSLQHEVLRTDNGFSHGESQRENLYQSSQAGQSSSRNVFDKDIEELVNYKLKADERIFQLTYINEDLKAEVY